MRARRAPWVRTPDPASQAAVPGDPDAGRLNPERDRPARLRGLFSGGLSGVGRPRRRTSRRPGSSLVGVPAWISGIWISGGPDREADAQERGYGAMRAAVR